jgi:hypothetical protein
MKLRILLAWALFLILPALAEAKMFRNAYLAFELPEGWNCSLESTEWLCRHQDSKASKEAIIIFTAKEVGPTDSYSIYEQTINTPRTVTDKSGKGVVSTVVMKAKQSKINDQLWVDGLQKGSEIPNYFTRYVATLKEKIAILVTFSAHAEYFAKYSTDFFKAIQSLRVIASKNLLAQPSGTSGAPNTSGVWGAASSAPGGLSMTGEAPFGRKKRSGSNDLKYILLTVGGLLVAAGAYFFMRTRRH